MGFDVSYHPISEPEIKEWYFDALGDEASADTLAAKHGVEAFYQAKYKDTLNVGRRTGAEESFDKTHAYYTAIVQGFFRTYFYIRGGAFTFAIENNPSLGRYTKSWTDILGHAIPQPVANQITENYCGGVYLSVDQVSRLRGDIETDAALCAELETRVFGEGTLAVFLKALRYAEENALGLLEATEVVEPNPLDLNKSSSYSNLFNCDKEGPLLYAEIATKQVAQAMAAFKKTDDGGDKPGKSGGFFRNLFK